MVDDGYLIGYEDAKGNFIQIGQFNNAADDVTKPLVLRHTNSGETLELDGSSFRPSTQIGDTNNRPDVFANAVDLNSLVGADTKADLTQSGGVLVASQLPDLAITNIDVVADQTARLALNAEEGDVAIQTDTSETFILSTNDPTVNSNWKKVQLDVLGAIDGQTITPAQTGTSTNRGNVFADTVDTNNLTGVQTGAKRQACRVTLGADQSLSAGSISQLQFDTKLLDTGANFDTTNNQWTCPKDGLYSVNLQVRFTGGSSGDQRTAVVGSGSSATPSLEGSFARHNSSSSGDSLSTSTINKYNQGDIIAGYAGNANSSDTVLSGFDNDNTFFEVAFLGSL